jgi:hypothetical protein
MFFVGFMVFGFCQMAAWWQDSEITVVFFVGICVIVFFWFFQMATWWARL